MLYAPGTKNSKFQEQHCDSVLMRPDGGTLLNVPTQQLKLGRSKSLNTPRSSNFSGMNVRSKRTFSLPNRERGSLPIVQINYSDNDKVDDDNTSDKETERTSYLFPTGRYVSSRGQEIEPLFGVLFSVVFLIWARMLET